MLHFLGKGVDDILDEHVNKQGQHTGGEDHQWTWDDEQADEETETDKG